MDVNLAAARIITVRELTRDTAAVLREINDKSEPALVTRHGRFVALLTPLEGTKLEVRALDRLGSELPDPDTLEHGPETTVSLGEARRESQ